MPKTKTQGPVARYEVTVEGQYYGVEDGNKVKKHYKITVKMTEKMLARPLSVIRNQVLPVLLPRLYPDYKRFRTHQITKVVDLLNPDKAPRNISLMSRQQLVSYARDKGLAIKFRLYPMVDDLRSAIVTCETDPEGFEAEQEKRRISLSEDIDIQTELAALNEELDLAGADPRSATFDPKSFDLESESEEDEEDELIEETLEPPVEPPVKGKKKKKADNDEADDL